MKPFKDKAVAHTFESYPPNMRNKLMAVRSLIFETAATTDGVGEIEEMLKWGEPAYLTSESKSGSTVRIAWNEKRPSQYAMYFICTTTLVEKFKTLFPDDFTFEDNRAIVIDEHDELPMGSLSVCIAAALTYHRDKKAARSKQLAG